jgi:hypothetical protein
VEATDVSEKPAASSFPMLEALISYVFYLQKPDFSVRTETPFSYKILLSIFLLLM